MKLTRSVLIYAIVLAAAIYGVTIVFFFRSLPEEPRDRLAVLYEADLNLEAEPILVALLEKDPGNIDLHYEHINNHYAIPEELDEDTARDDETIRQYYETLSLNPELAGIGHYGLGLIHSLEQNYPLALEHFKQVSDTTQPYLNNSTGYVYRQMGDLEQAELYFLKEIEVEGNIAGAVSNLAPIYLKQQRLADLAVLSDNPAARSYLGSQSERLLALWGGSWGDYLRLVITGPLQHIQFLALMSALAVGAMWFIFFWRIDVFEQEQPQALVIALVLGAISALVTLVLSDTLLYFYPIMLGETAQSDFIHSVVHIGMVEEAAKFAAVLATVALFRQHVNEPVDYVIYGSLVALGFATLENALYFSSYGLGITFVRFLMSTVMHMGMTSIICYAWALGLRRSEVWAGLMILLGFALASLIHGLYDFVLLTDFLSLAIAAFAILIALAFIYGKMLTNTLNLSPYFDPEKLKSRRLVNYSLLGSAVILALMIGFLHNNFALTTAIARDRLIPSGGVMLIMVYFVFIALGEFKVIEGEMVPLLRRRKKT